MKTKGRSIAALVILAIAAVSLSFVALFGANSSGALSVKNVKLGLDLSGGVAIVYQAEEEDITEADMATAVGLIQHRLDRKGWSEAEASRQGENRIRVEIPGVEDAEEAVTELGKTAQLMFLDADGNLILTGADVAEARKEVGATSQNGMPEPYVALRFTSEGAKAFGEATSKNIGKPIYIVMDEDVISAPLVNSAITTGECIISGSFTPESAEELASLIREGAMPFNLTVMEMNNVGARLGHNAVETSVTAAIVGVALVLLFMLLIYKGLGIAADWALIIYLALEAICISAFNVTLTLPGIAGVILSVGMAVDANVIIFERMKEELVEGKDVKSAIKAGFSRALPAIVDGNITTFIAAVVLYFMGTGTIKGFAFTLMIGIGVSMFTALVITKLIIKGLVGIGITKPTFYGVKASKIKEAGREE